MLTPRILARGAAVILLGIVASTAMAQTANITGKLLYTDLGGGTFDLRSVTVELWDSNVGFDTLLGTTLLGNNGNYQFNSVPLPDTEFLPGTGNIDPYIRVILDDDANSLNGYFVFKDSASGDPVYEKSSTPVNNIAGNTVINQTYAGTEFNRAANLFDQLVQGNFGAGVIRPGLPSIANTLRLDYPEASGAESAFYQGGTKTVNIGSNLYAAWDVTLHEYGHFMSDLDNLDNSPGGFHCFGISNITGGPCGTNNVPALNKDAGTRLAWGEGLADYLTIAIQDVGGFNQPGVPTVGNATYTHRSSVGANQFTVPVEGNGTNDGEGDEASIMRILWDIADGTTAPSVNEAHDQIGIGHAALYGDLKAIGGVVRLDQVWDYYFANTGELGLTGVAQADQRRAILGDIFEEYDVSPDPQAFANPIDLTNFVPIFNWTKNNESANDEFDIIIFSNDFSSRVLEIDVPGDVTSYTLTEAQRQALLAAGLGTYQFVVVGADTSTFATGPYWSGAESITFIPQPASLALLALGGLAALRRRST